MADHYYSRKPTAASDRHTIQCELRGREFVFVTDAGVFSKEGIDFGSRLLIDTMDIALTDEVLDVGCGYGPIGLSAAALAEQGRVTMVDINERAVELAKENAVRNGIGNADIVQGDLFEAVQGRTFTKILSNPPIRAGKQVVHRIFEEAYHHLTEGGQLWIVIQKKQGAPSALAKLESLFENVREADKDKGYRIYCATK
ncbi:class I SAM-dependent methyltransferase [Paenibacillus oceani]|uniref:Class I SAM-dependent methyltransferase n=1 Tax=Paenibacillus oceani TaxID=2772510 RepID=A0A927CF01_9BACL|nr:class I SAM-dependent methyltransferase [Paenibacillus oceani]MBD2866259.1 class I SAM-dependent methyltransferase [Paenibacillus oceani]